MHVTLSPFLVLATIIIVWGKPLLDNAILLSGNACSVCTAVYVRLGLSTLMMWYDVI